MPGTAVAGECVLNQRETWMRAGDQGTRRSPPPGSDSGYLGYDHLVSDREFPVTDFDASRPNVARVYDYLLGGKDNFAADRAVAEQMIASLPAVQVGARPA